MNKEEAAQLLRCSPNASIEVVKYQFELAKNYILAKEDSPFYSRKEKLEELEMAFSIIHPEYMHPLSPEIEKKELNNDVRKRREQDFMWIKDCIKHFSDSIKEIPIGNWYSYFATAFKTFRMPVLIGIVIVILINFLKWPPAINPFQNNLSMSPQTLSDTSPPQTLPDTAGIVFAINAHVDTFMSHLNHFTNSSKSIDKKKEGESVFLKLFDASVWANDSIIEVINVETGKGKYYSINRYASLHTGDPYFGVKSSKEYIRDVVMISDKYQKPYVFTAKIGQRSIGKIHYDLTEKIFQFNIYKDNDKWAPKILKITADTIVESDKKNVN